MRLWFQMGAVARAHAPACQRPLIGLAAVLWLALRTAGSQSYFVDFEAGRDAADGRSPGTAWQHAPGDTAGTGVAAATALAPGDTVMFKGGVRYRGSVTCKWSGTPDSPITYDGNSAGTFGVGRAVIDGSEPIRGWTAATSAAECGGNPHWTNLWVTTVPSGFDVLSANLYEDDRMLWPAQHPNLADPFFSDDLATFRPISSDNVTRTTLTDPACFTQSDSNAWNGAYLRLWGNPNQVRVLQITGFDPSAHRIVFSDTGATSLYTGRTVYYALVNHIAHLDTPGEFAVGDTPEPDGTRRVWLWPRAARDPNAADVTRSVRRTGVDLAGRDSVTVQGFLIQKHAAKAGEYRFGNAILTYQGGKHLVVRSNEMARNLSIEHQGVIRMYGGCADVTIEDNLIHENPLNRGAILTFDDSVFRNNRLWLNGGTAVDFYGCRRSQMTENTVSENSGVHANGLTLYLGCEDCLVAYNTVFDGGVALTVQDARRITVAYNVFHTDLDAYTLGDWGRCLDLYYYNNVMLNAFGKALLRSASTTNVVARNNIVDGSALASGSNVSHNIYTSLMWSQTAAKGWSLGQGESIQTNRSKVFLAAPARDFRLHPFATAIDAGIGVGLTRDHAGHPVAVGSAPDIGAFEYDPEIADSDEDGMPDGWETRYGLSVTNAADASGNRDLDPLTNFAEWSADTDPTNPVSFLRIESLSATTPKHVHFHSSARRHYMLQWTADLATPSWTNTAGQTYHLGCDGPDWLDAPDEGVATRFFRVRVKGS